jgi:hypothetical protein
MLEYLPQVSTHEVNDAIWFDGIDYNLQRKQISEEATKTQKKNFHPEEFGVYKLKDLVSYVVCYPCITLVATPIDSLLSNIREYGMESSRSYKKKQFWRGESGLIDSRVGSDTKTVAYLEERRIGGERITAMISVNTEVTVAEEFDQLETILESSWDARRGDAPRMIEQDGILHSVDQAENSPFHDNRVIDVTNNDGRCFPNQQRYYTKDHLRPEQPFHLIVTRYDRNPDTVIGYQLNDFPEFEGIEMEKEGEYSSDKIFNHKVPDVRYLVSEYEEGTDG